MVSAAFIDIVHIPLNQNPLQARVEFVAGMTLEDALAQSGLLEKHPELHGLSVGIFSRAVPLDTPLKAGDRVELYRPLQLNPMEIRRQRARSKPAHRR